MSFLYTERLFLFWSSTSPVLYFVWCDFLWVGFIFCTIWFTIWLSIRSVLNIQKKKLYLNHCKCISEFSRMWSLLHSQLIQSWLVLITFRFPVLRLWSLILQPSRLRRIPALLIWIFLLYFIRVDDLSPYVLFQILFFMIV